MIAAVSVLGRARGARRCSRTGRIGSPRAKSRRRRRVRRVSSAISSSRCGTGAARRRSRTTSSRPTSAIRRPTPTVRSTASTGATTGSSRSTRWSTPRRRREFRCSIRRRRPANRSRCRCRRRTGAPSCTGSTRRSRTTRRWTARGASGCRRGSAVPENQPVVLQEPSVRGAGAAADELPADSVLRPAHEAVPAGRHLLRHASRAVRERRRRDALRQRSSSAARSAG